jgi:hypothetical protein
MTANDENPPRSHPPARVIGDDGRFRHADVVRVLHIPASLLAPFQRTP